MNVAIIIGVSKYSDAKNNLPGCQNDAEIVYNIISKTGKYEEILYISDGSTSSKLKDRVISFISDNKGKKIQEFLIYYTGHGEFYNDDFYYILSDFDPLKRKQTSLQNEEVDNLIKTLSPELVVKIIDACQSGKTYIKETESITKYFQKTQDRFNKCYFLNSSLRDQSSYQTSHLSDFTASFVNALKEHQADDIRYKDIIDYISDEFESNNQQTPFFVIQAEYTEKFCALNTALKDYLSTLSEQTIQVEESPNESLSVIDRIKKDAESYITKAGAMELIDSIRISVETFKLDEKLSDIYNLEILFAENYNGLIDKDSIGVWLDEHPNEYMAKSSYRSVEKPRKQSSLSFFWSDMAYTPEYEKVRNGFELEVEVPYKTLIFNLNSNFPNVNSYTCRIVYLLSKKRIKFFYFITNFNTKNWEERRLNTKTEWISIELPIKDSEKVITEIRKVFEKLELTAETAIKNEFETSMSLNITYNP